MASSPPSSDRVASFALLDALVSDSPVGLGFWDTDARYRRLNAWLAGMAGAPADDHIGRTLPEMLGPLGEQLEAAAREVLRTGESVAEAEFSGEVPGSPGLERHWRVSLYPIDASDQTALGFGATVVDVTAERREAERAQHEADDERREHARDNHTRAEVLARASGALSASLDSEAVLDALVGALVPELADWCTIHTAHPDTLALRAVAHTDPARAKLAWELARSTPSSARATVGAAAVIRTGRREVHTEISNSLLAPADGDAEPLRVMQQLGLRSAVVLPLLAGRRVLGALTLAMGDSGRRYTGETLDLAESVAAQAAAALDNARLYAEQEAIAHTLQQSLLPPALPDVTGLDLAACYRPSGRANEVGGDFYDVFAGADDGWRILIGDVVGKGPAAAALTALVRYMLHGAEMARMPLAAKLATVNEALFNRPGGVQFCSAVYGRLAPRERGADVTLISCGHPPPLVRRADGSLEDVPGGGPLLGVGEAPQFVEHQVALGPGDTLLLYTDGVIELPGREPWRGMDLLRETLTDAAGTTAGDLVHRIEQATLRASGGEPRDDVALLAVVVPA